MFLELDDGPGLQVQAYLSLSVMEPYLWLWAIVTTKAYIQLTRVGHILVQYYTTISASGLRLHLHQRRNAVQGLEANPPIADPV